MEILFYLFTGSIKHRQRIFNIFFQPDCQKIKKIRKSLPSVDAVTLQDAFNKILDNCTCVIALLSYLHDF